MSKNVIKIIDSGKDGYLLIVDGKEIRFRTFTDAESFIKKLSQETRQDYTWEYDSDYIAERAVAPTSFRSVQQLTPLMVADQQLNGLADDDEDDDVDVELVKEFIMDESYQAGKDYINDEYTDTNIVKVAELFSRFAPVIDVPEIEIKERLVEGGLDEIARIENISL